ncbi:MAG: phosphocholine cytidylyltransferase family protein [Peptococcaceae bacterium]|nr:phosphocholine cytidylyltransferase family protein [Peptococcaceae bacterium]
MSMSKECFEILVLVEGGKGVPSVGDLRELTGLSEERVRESLGVLYMGGLLDDRGVTFAGSEALSPYRAKRAVFLAAGFGSRMLPVTLMTPKPLVMVNGTRIIDRLLDAVTAVGIKEIYIVVGYLSEVFRQLLEKYPHITFIENPVYSKGNNISSAYFARDFFENAYVFESDLLLYNSELITKYQYGSNYLGVPVKRTDDWCLLSQEGRISAMQLGGENCYHMYSISYWTQQDGVRLRHHLRDIYQQAQYRNIFWDQVPLECFRDEYHVAIRECAFSDIVEIDTLKELMLIDPSYRYTVSNFS